MMGYEGGYVRSDTCAVLGGDGAILGGDREVVGGDLAVACGDGEILCRAGEILGGESDSGRVEGAKGGHPRGSIAQLGGFPTELNGCTTFDDKRGGTTRARSNELEQERRRARQSACAGGSPNGAVRCAPASPMWEGWRRRTTARDRRSTLGTTPACSASGHPTTGANYCSSSLARRNTPRVRLAVRGALEHTPGLGPRRCRKAQAANERRDRAATPRGLRRLGFVSRGKLAGPFVSELPGGVVALDRGGRCSRFAVDCSPVRLDDQVRASLGEGFDRHDAAEWTACVEC